MTFFSSTPVFGRAEFAKAVGRQPGDRAITELLKYHLRVRHILRISRGVFATQKGIIPATGSADRLLTASRLRGGAVIGFRSALELHLCAVAPTSEVQLIACGEPGLVRIADFACRLVRPPSHYSSGEGITTIERQGLAVNVTTLERTLVDLFDRYDLAGGAEDLFQSLDSITERQAPLDIEALAGFAKRLSNAAAIGALGFWLDREQNLIGATPAVLADLRSRAPRHCRYALGAKPGNGRVATGWNVILPANIIERYFDD